MVHTLQIRLQRKVKKAVLLRSRDAHHILISRRALALELRTLMENPRSNILPVSGGKRKETAVSKKSTVFMHIMILACMPIRLDKSYLEVSSRPCDVPQLPKHRRHCHFENNTD